MNRTSTIILILLLFISPCRADWDTVGDVSTTTLYGALTASLAYATYAAGKVCLKSICEIKKSEPCSKNLKYAALATWMGLVSCMALGSTILVGIWTHEWINVSYANLRTTFRRSSQTG
jgi:hypothetical protein